MTATHPKTFLSYSWTTPDHEQWVLRLATDLVGAGVDIIIDKWHLKEGHDANAFMERMVTDPDITKVLLICDKGYVEKTNARKGGVGTEAQIISAEIYNKLDQNKFVAIVKERDDSGNPYLPIYYKSRIFIDLSDPATSDQNFERLERWIYDKPLYVRPELGTMPEYLNDGSSLSLPTAARYIRANDAIRNGRSYAVPAIRDYFTTLVDSLEKLQLTGLESPLDDAIVQGIEEFKPYRDETLQIFFAIAKYRDDDDTRRALHLFFERVLSYYWPPASLTRYKETQWDHFKFIVHELFLYLIAILINADRFSTVNYLLSTDYYVTIRDDDIEARLLSFDSIHRYLKSFETRNIRLELNRASLRADLLRKRLPRSEIAFRDLAQADFVLYLRSALDDSGIENTWIPDTLVFGDRFETGFEIFRKSRSRAYCERSLAAMGVGSMEKLKEYLETVSKNKRLLPRWGWHSFNPSLLMTFTELCTRP